MKNKFMIISFFLLSVCAIFGQSRTASDVREIIADGPSQFKNLQKELIEEKSKNGYTFYTTKINHSYLSESYIRRNENEPAQYIIKYKIDKTNPGSFEFLKQTFEEYRVEFEAMINSGNYRAQQKTESGVLAIQVTDLNNQIVLQHESSKEGLVLYFFGITN